MCEFYINYISVTSLKKSRANRSSDTNRKSKNWSETNYMPNFHKEPKVSIMQFLEPLLFPKVDI
jgi:hypothetical protein